MIILSGTSQATKIKQGYLYIKSNMGIALVTVHTERSTKGITHIPKRERERLKTSKGLKDYKNIPLADYKQLNAQR